MPGNLPLPENGGFLSETRIGIGVRRFMINKKMKLTFKAKLWSSANASCQDK
jgi:hypothetical protein